MGHGLDVQLLLFTSKVSVSCANKPSSVGICLRLDKDVQIATKVVSSHGHHATEHHVPPKVGVPKTMLAVWMHTCSAGCHSLGCCTFISQE